LDYLQALLIGLNELGPASDSAKWAKQVPSAEVGRLQPNLADFVVIAEQEVMAALA